VVTLAPEEQMPLRTALERRLAVLVMTMAGAPAPNARAMTSVVVREPAGRSR
jgi:hypothetical protein